MISKAHRFTRRDFSFLRPKMKKFRTGDFLFFYCALPHTCRLAAVISKKVDKKAVARNAWRRSVYDLVGQEFIKSTTGMALVCLYKGEAIPENNRALKTAWHEFKRFAETKKLLTFD